MYRLIIPTRDSARWVGELLQAYRQLGLEPLYIVDARSRDGTIDLLTGMKADTVLFTPSGDFVEAGMVEFGAKAAASEWVFRLDDDEFPSRALVAWLNSTATRSVRPGWFLSRRDLFRSNGLVWYNRRRSAYTHAARPCFLGPHSRLFRPKVQRFHAALHSSAIVDEELFGYAPEHAFFVHLSGLILSKGDRLAKIRKYEAISPESTWRLTDEYLPELFDVDHLRPGHDGLEEFAPIIERLSAPLATAFFLDRAELDFAKSEIERWNLELASMKQRRVRFSPDDAVDLLRFVPRMFWYAVGVICSAAARALANERLRTRGRTIRALSYFYNGKWPYP